MTRTARSVSPRALMKDRSESKSGLDKSIRKGGGGAHSWGKLEDEAELEYAGMRDEEAEIEKLQARKERNSPSTSPTRSELVENRAGSPSQQDLETAREFRKNALKGQDLDLSAIARTSAGAVSPAPQPNRNTSSDIESLSGIV